MIAVCDVVDFGGANFVVLVACTPLLSSAPRHCCDCGANIYIGWRNYARGGSGGSKKGQANNGLRVPGTLHQLRTLPTVDLVSVHMRLTGGPTA